MACAPFTLVPVTPADATESPIETTIEVVESGIWLRHACIEQAKGALTALFGIDDDDAYAVLLAESQSRNIKVHVVARAVLQSLRRTGESPEAAASAHTALGRLLVGGGAARPRTAR